MTPTLAGRLETRIVLSFFVALPVLVFAGMANIIFIMLAVGVALDFVYNYLQYKRWDGDWPLGFSFIAGVTEGIILWLIIDIRIPIYVLILVLTLTAQVLLGVFFPYRRFKGGRIL